MFLTLFIIIFCFLIIGHFTIVGGHTAEMLNLLSVLQKDRFSPRTYIAAATDNMSLQKARLFENSLADEVDIVLVFHFNLLFSLSLSLSLSIICLPVKEGFVLFKVKCIPDLFSFRKLPPFFALLADLYSCTKSL